MQQGEMTGVLTLVVGDHGAAGGDGADTLEVAAAGCIERLEGQGARAVESRRLSARALDLFFAGPDAATVAAGLRGGHDSTAAQAAALRRCDWAVQPVAERQRRLLVADMESTVIDNEMLDELADAVGCRPEMAAITARAMNDDIDFEEALRQRVMKLAGLPKAELDRAAERITIDSGAAVLVATLKERGVRTVLASGGFTYFAEPIARRLGFDHCAANVLELDGEHLTGGVVPPILDRQAKVDILRRHCAELGITPQQVMAVGDGANDLPMLKLAGLGVAFHGKPKVVAEAPFSIRHGRLDTLLFFLGIADSEWATVPSSSG